ncbi:hypothetical protein GCM10022251_77160 [Phytohabitans flavus]|uniref:DUF6924 domain-containing protein n=1 Tax=Phytohabitans flavus TaxID=1076124 RepID=A0A6F8XLL7_9ACTN|nr:hypothetical protein [Phytohabitans flavus]BCB74710.1 hypothetical protein Pflav_011200 [Phytohabitans flavus]
MSDDFDPESDSALVFRADFVHQAEWEAVRAAIEAPEDDEFLAYVQFVENRKYEGLTAARLLEIEAGKMGGFAFIVDTETLTNPEHPVLVVNLNNWSEDDDDDADDGDDDEIHGEQDSRYGETFRVIPDAMWSVENNLSLANMDWEDFADSVGADGVFRGF